MSAPEFPPEMVEAVARSLWDHNGHYSHMENDEPWGTWDAPLDMSPEEAEGHRDGFRSQAITILRTLAARGALLPAGWVAVPREPTEAMLKAPLHVGRPWSERDPLGAMPGQRVFESRVDLRPIIYRAMLAAAPRPGESA